MIKVVRASDKSAIDQGWLKGRQSFSFGSYYDPDNTSFGVMRVCNDDEIGAGRGFGPHPHSDMEVVTIVLEGGIRHQDNLGHTVVTKAGEVQRMTTGTGIVHAEYNGSDRETLRSLQLWFEPAERGLAPSFESIPYPADAMVNAILPVVTPEGGPHAASIHQDLTIGLCRLEPGKTLDFRQRNGRRCFLLAIEGGLTVNGTALGERDEARIEATPQLALETADGCFFMLIDLP